MVVVVRDDGGSVAAVWRWRRWLVMVGWRGACGFGRVGGWDVRCGRSGPLFQTQIRDKRRHAPLLNCKKISAQISEDLCRYML